MNVWKQSMHRLYEALQNPHAANSMWLAQFICAPQFFKTPSGLCGHTVHYFPHVREYAYLSAWKNEKKKHSVALVRERTIPAERPPLVGEVNANFCG
jgi:hypothetical protein